MVGFLDRCIFNPAAGGLADFVVSSAVGGYRTPAGAGALDGNTYRYFAESGDRTQWELGDGVYTFGTATLARTTIRASSTGSKVNFTAAPTISICAVALDVLAGWGGMESVMANGRVDISVSGNALTAALKTISGNDPSTSDPVLVRFRDITATNARYNDRVITAALAVTVPNGSHFGNPANEPFRLQVSLHDGPTAVRMGLSQWASLPNGDFGDWNIRRPNEHVLANTNQVGSSSTAHNFYTNAEALSSRPWRRIAVAEWENGLATQGAWAVGPDRASLTGPASPWPGDVIRKLGASYTAAQSFNTTSYVVHASNTIGIISQSKANVLLLRAIGNGYITTGGRTGILAIMLSGTTKAGHAAVYAGSNDAESSMAIETITRARAYTTVDVYGKVDDTTGSPSFVWPAQSSVGDTAKGTLLVDEIYT